MSEVVVSGITAADVLDAIRAASDPEPNADPEWKPAREWAREWGMSPTSAGRHLAVGIAKGLVAKEFRVAAGYKRPIEHYRFVGKRKGSK